MTARVYGAWGINMWPGGAPLADAELLALGPARFIHDTRCDHDGSADLVLILDGDGPLPPDALAHVVSVLDAGGAVAVHGTEDATVAIASASICRLLGGAHA